MLTKAPALWPSVFTIVERIDRRPYFIAIRRGLALTLPLIMIGALALLLRFPSIGGMQLFLTKAFGSQLNFYCDSLIASTFGIGSLVALYGFTDALTNLHNQRFGHRVVNPTIAVMVVVSCFFTLIAPNRDATLAASLSLGQGML